MDHLDWHMARAALQWQAELGVSDAVGDVPIDRYDAPAQSPKPAHCGCDASQARHEDADLPAAAMAVAPAADPVAVAEAAAAAAEDLPALTTSHCKIFRIAITPRGAQFGVWRGHGRRPA